MLFSVCYRGLEKTDEALKTRDPDLLSQAGRSGRWRRVLRVAPAQKAGAAAAGTHQDEPLAPADISQKNR
jgi:hypothetical protein